MAFENTITEHDLDPQAQRFLQANRMDATDLEPDLAVDGLSDSILSRLIGLFDFSSRR